MGFKDKLSKTINVAADKSAKLASLAKTKLEISNTKSSIQQHYKDLGVAVYEALKSDVDVSEDVNTYCEEIDKFTEKLAILEESLNSKS